MLANLMGKEIDYEYKENTWYRRWDKLRSTWLEYDFPGWLGEECAGGWEVVSISRDESSKPKTTWCVFRRKR